MRYWGCIFLSVAGCAFGTALTIIAWRYMGLHGLLVVGVLLGGIGGGFTQALSGGERYGLKMPTTRAGAGSVQKVDPGFIGDMFVGLMAGILGISLCSRTLKTSLFDPSGSSLIDLWFMDFGIAFVSGFLGLRLIKAISTKFMQEQRLKEAEDLAVESKELATANAGTSAYLSGQQSLRSGQLDLAEDLFRKGIEYDRGTSIRCIVGLAQLQRRRHKYTEAIETLDEAIRLQHIESVVSRVAVAYWNRACYRLLARPDSVEAKDAAVADLEKSVALQESFRSTILADEDLKELRNDVRIRRLIQEPDGSAQPRRDDMSSEKTTG